MRGVENRLAKIERAKAVEVEAEKQAFRKAWCAAGGPISLVYGATPEECQSRVDMLRQAGAITPLDKVHQIAALDADGNTFIRKLFWRDFTDQDRDKIRAAIRTRRAELAEAREAV